MKKTSSLLLLPALFALLSPPLFAADIDTVQQRYLHWVLDAPDTDHTKPLVASRYYQVTRQAKKAQAALQKITPFNGQDALYDTRRAGSDQQEVNLLVKEALPNLAIAYHLPGSPTEPNPFHHDPDVLRQLLSCFDRLHDRGFRKGMYLPWKPQQVPEGGSDRGVIVDFQLRTAGYAIATFLMREELRSADRLERSLDTCRDILSHGEKFGDPNALKQNADGIRIAINVALPYALAARDVPRLERLRDQIDRSMTPESNASDTIKPDGLGFHHRGVYLVGYSAYAMSQCAMAAWLFDETDFACDPETLAQLSKGLEVLRIVSNKYDMHPALAGRLKSISVIPRVLLGYAYLSDIKHPQQNAFKGMLADLADTSFMTGRQAYFAVSPQRNEVPPGPGAVSFFLQSISRAHSHGAARPPSGHWSFNYGPLSVHRRDHWMVSVKGHSTYWWAFERSLIDARKDERRENVFGYHDGSASLRIYAKGDALKSGYAPKGWDPTRIPGATTRLIPTHKLLELDEARTGKPLNRPFGRSAFAGGVSLKNTHGLFAMEHEEVTPEHRSSSLSAMKAMFFFGDQIVVITDKIENSEGSYPVATTLYQSALSNPHVPTSIRGKPITDLGETQRIDDGKPLTLMDPVGNGYYIPHAKKVRVRRATQTHLDSYTGSQSHSGDFATAWIDHGAWPDRVYCEYVILVDTDPDTLAQFAADAEKQYRVLQRNSRGLIVEHLPLGLTGYALHRANVEIERGLIAQVSAPCLAMTEEHNENNLHLSVCNPDLGWKRGERFDFKGKDGEHIPRDPVPMPVTTTLRGEWIIAQPHPEVSIQASDAESTTLHFTTDDARSIEVELRRVPAKK